MPAPFFGGLGVVGLRIASRSFRFVRVRLTSPLSRGTTRFDLHNNARL